VTVEGDRWTCDTNDAVATRSTRDQLNLGTIKLHHQPSVRLLVERGPHLPHLRLHSEQGARKGQGGSPLTRTRLSGQLLDAGLGVVVALHDVVRCVRCAQHAAIEPQTAITNHLRHSGVRLVGARWAAALVPEKTRLFIGANTPDDCQVATAHL
jgi:hypothetical protein